MTGNKQTPRTALLDLDLSVNLTAVLIITLLSLALDIFFKLSLVSTEPSGIFLKFKLETGMNTS